MTHRSRPRNFIRVSSGPEIGAYYHEFFLRDKPHLAAQMFCKNARAKLAMASGEGPKPEATPSQIASPVAVAPAMTAAPMTSAQRPSLPSQISPGLLALLEQRKHEQLAAALSFSSNTQMLEYQVRILEEEQRMSFQRQRLEQMMELRMQQQRRRLPFTNRASAA